MTVKLFKAYNEEENTDTCLEYKEKANVTDQEVISYLHALGIMSTSELQKFEKIESDNVVRMLKELNGVTVRQLSRITGISKSVIDRM